MKDSTESNPTFDELRYLDSWHGLANRYGKESAITWLIVWQTLSHWNIDIWPMLLVHVFGFDVEAVVKNLSENPPVLTDRFLLIKGDDYPNRIKEYCNRVLKEFRTWSSYDP